MKRSALLGALATGALLVAGSAFATGVYVNGVYTESGGTVTVPANGSITISPSYGGTATSVAPASTYPTIGTVYEQPVTTHGSYSSASSYSSGSTYSSGQYQVIDTGTTYETVPAYEPAPMYETAPMYEAAPAAVPAYSHAPVRVEPIAPATVTVNHATPAPVAEPAQRGWGRSRIYIAPRASIVLPTDTEYTLREQGLPPLKLENAYNDVAWGGSVALGFQAVPMGWGVNVRTEIEGGYQSQEVDSHNLVGVQTVGGDDARGDTNLLYGFVNLYGDIPVLHGLGITLGGGAGIGRVEFDGHGTRAAGNALDDSATAFGYHLDAGVSYDITDAVTLEAMYRYQSFVDAELKTTAGNEEKVDLNTHNIVLGARIGF